MPFPLKLEQPNIELLQSIFVSACAVQIHKKVNQIFTKRCCGCKSLWKNTDCQMLNDEEKLDLYFEEALSGIERFVVEAKLRECVNAIAPDQHNPELFYRAHCRDPRVDEKWKERVKSNVRGIMEFKW